MKRKFISTQLLKTCLQQDSSRRSDIHTQLAETIADRKKVIAKWEQLFFETPAGRTKDIHTELEKTIAMRKLIMLQWQQILSPSNNRNISVPDRQAA